MLSRFWLGIALTVLTLLTACNDAKPVKVACSKEWLAQA